MRWRNALKRTKLQDVRTMLLWQHPFRKKILFIVFANSCQTSHSDVINTKIEMEFGGKCDVKNKRSKITTMCQNPK